MPDPFRSKASHLKVPVYYLRDRGCKTWARKCDWCPRADCRYDKDRERVAVLRLVVG